MKQLLFLSGIFLLFLNSCDQVTGSGHIVTEKRTVDNFNAISVSNSFDVEVKIGAATEVKVEADDNVIKYVVTTVSGNTLKIKMDGFHSTGNIHLKVYITTPSLNDINASASADVKVIDPIKGAGKINFNVSSAASIDATVEAPEVEAEASSSGTITLRGKTKTYTAQASSAGGLKTGELLSENTDVSVSSGANADVFASVNLTADASSGGDITWHGEGNVKQTISSGGSIEKK